MKKFTTIAILALLTSALTFSSCQKDEVIDPEKVRIQELLALQEEITLEQLLDPKPDAEDRGYCAAHAIKVEYDDFFEYEFDINLDGLGRIHFANNKTGFTKILTKLPIAVQTRLITMTNIPNSKKNPTCPWMSKKGEIKVTIFQATKDAYGIWVPVKDTPFITYTLGDGTPTEVTKFGSRVFCIDKPIGKWFYCTLSK